MAAAMMNPVFAPLTCLAAVLAAGMLSVSPVYAAAPQKFEKPVIVGLDGAEFDACAAIGEVRGLTGDGDVRLSVLAGPHNSAVEIDRLRNGAPVILCDSSRDGKWSGIVYPAAGQALADCGTSSPVAKPSPYRGPCRSGWVASTFVVATAG